MAKISPEIKKLHDKRWDTVHKIRDLIKEKDSKKKYDTLIKLCKDLHEIVDTINDKGGKADAVAQRFNVDYWKDRYNKYVERTKSKQKPIKEPTIPRKSRKALTAVSTDIQNLYYIMLCWTAKPEYCVCDSIIENIKSYLETMKCEYFDNEAALFPDRIEYCTTFKLRATNDVYEVILSSAKYILDMTIDSIYDNCNIGIFGKKID